MKNSTKTIALVGLLAPLLGLAACGGNECPPTGLGGQSGGDGGGLSDPSIFISIGDVTLPEGDAGTTAFQFPVSLSSVMETAVMVTFTTFDGSAGSTAGASDFESRTGTLTFTPGTTQAAIIVSVNGDEEFEGDETFFVRLQGIDGIDVGFSDPEAVGRIADDDEFKFSISDLVALECDITNPLLWFEVSLSSPHEETVSVEYVTKDGTANHGPAPEDYIWRRDTLEFLPGETLKTFEIRIVGDLVPEADESFQVELFGAVGTGVNIGDGVAVGTILDDDTLERVDRDTGLASATAPRFAGSGDHLYTVWQDDRFGSSAVFFNRSSNGGRDWSSSDRRISSSPQGVGQAIEPRIAVSGDSVYVVWEDTRNGKSDIYFNRSIDGGTTWMIQDLLLDDDIPGKHASRRPRIAADGDRVYVSWLDWRDGLSGVYTNSSFDAGGTWPMAPQLISGGHPFGSSASSAEICADGLSVHIAWSDDRNGETDLFVNSSSDGGLNWPMGGTRIDSDIPGQFASENPRTTCVGDSLYIVWEEHRFGTTDVYFNRSADGGMTFLPFDKRLVADMPGTSESRNPSISALGSAVMVAWESSKDGAAEDIRFSGSLDGGITFRGNPRVDRAESPGLSRSLDPQVAFNGNRVVVVWRDERNGTESDVLVGWSSDLGSTFHSNLIRLDGGTPGAASSLAPRIWNDGDDGFHFVWQDTDGGSSDIVSRRLCLP